MKIAERPHATTIAIGVATVIIAAIATWLQYRSAQSHNETLGILVLAENANGSPIADAEVSLNIPQLNPEYTDTKGQIAFKLPKQVLGLDGRIKVRKEGFQNYNQQIPLEPRSDYYPVYLQKIPPPKPADLKPARPAAVQPSGKSQVSNTQVTGTATTHEKNSPAFVGRDATFNINSSDTPKKAGEPQK